MCGYRVKEKDVVGVGGGIGTVEEFSFTRFKFWCFKN